MGSSWARAVWLKCRHWRGAGWRDQGSRDQGEQWQRAGHAFSCAHGMAAAHPALLSPASPWTVYVLIPQALRVRMDSMLSLSNLLSLPAFPAPISGAVHLPGCTRPKSELGLHASLTSSMQLLTQGFQCSPGTFSVLPYSTPIAMDPGCLLLDSIKLDRFVGKAEEADCGLMLEERRQLHSLTDVSVT